ncbi:MAG TPA: hypothetical protein VIY49_27365 [Bryobacteraceae bacterium]
MRQFRSRTGVTVLTVAAVFMPLLAQTASNGSVVSAPDTRAKIWKVGRTPDGKPDLQGYWTNLITTPLERAANLGAKEFYTPEEAAANATRGAGRGGAAQASGELRVHYNEIQFGLDRSQTTKVSGLRTSLIIGPEGKIPLMTPEAQGRNGERAALAKGHEFDGPENRGLAERCLTFVSDGPPMMAPAYNGNYQIVQGDGYVTILIEMMHRLRVIPTDGRPHIPATIRQWNGDSVGHWEGDTLVVDTTNFTDKTNFRGSGENLHVIERFTRVAEDTLLYQFTVDDPSTWIKPWTAEISMPKVEGPIFEYACQEGNYGLPNVLSGARATEKASAVGSPTQ